MEFKNLLVVLPVALSTILIFGYVGLYAPQKSSEIHKADFSVKSPVEFSFPPLSDSSSPPPPGAGGSLPNLLPVLTSDSDSDTCSCPTTTLADDCRNTAFPVMGGLDFVQYFSFKNPDGTYDETKVGVAGSSSFTYVFNGFKFYFLNQENLNQFSASPESYVPQYGGFCSWGMSGEVCPPYAWSADCLGPSGSWAHWTIVNEKLYFFKSSSPKEKFLDPQTDYVTSGDSHWNGWFGEAKLAQFSTTCYTSN